MPSRRLKATRRDVLMGAAALLLLVSNARGADAGKLEKITLRISAGTAAATLAEFVRQTGLQVLFESDAISNATTREIEGHLDVREALSLMFEGSDLTFEFINERTVAVRPRSRGTTVVAQPSSRM
jgi:iron complex outermembrane recepter protein